MVTMTRADAPAVPGLQSHPQAPPQQHALQPQPVSLSSASARPLSSTFSQRLPPLAMSIGTAPVPGAPHLQRPPGLGQQQSSTRTLQGPSAQDWARHRDIIVDLYRQYPLKKVSDIMRSQYNFSARYFGVPSVRLYQLNQTIDGVFVTMFLSPFQHGHNICTPSETLSCPHHCTHPSSRSFHGS